MLFIFIVISELKLSNLILVIPLVLGFYKNYK